MSGVHRLPSELWRMIIRQATFTDEPASISSAFTPLDIETAEQPPCLKNDAPLTPVLYHRKSGSAHSAIQAFTQAGTKRSIAFVCRAFNRLVGEYLFEKLYISEPKSAHRLASTFEQSSVYENPGRWTRHITIVGVFFTYPHSSGELASAAVRILTHTPHLVSFHLSWNATTREFRERERMIVAAVPANELRHFEWECTGGGFERQQDHPFYQLLCSAGFTLRVLKLTGYLPLAELPMPSSTSQSQESLQAEDTNSRTFLRLTHLKIRRAFRDDLLFISQWAISSSLTCLSLGSIWAYFDQRELAFSFWDTPKPSLRCLHLGEGSNVAPSLARKILRSAENLRVLEYFYLGEWERDTWLGVRHEKLEVVKVHVSHPVIALRSLFNSRRFSRDQQWEKIMRHLSPFLGYPEYAYQEENQEQDQLASVTSYPRPLTEFPAMKKLVFLEYKRTSEELQYEPAELAEWLLRTISESELNTNVEMLVEVEDYIR